VIVVAVAAALVVALLAALLVADRAAVIHVQGRIAAQVGTGVFLPGRR
jgi:hypothetical protein